MHLYVRSKKACFLLYLLQDEYSLYIWSSQGIIVVDMQKLASEFIGLPIVSVQNADNLGNVTGLIIKSNDLKIILCTVTVIGSREKHYLLPRDIRHFNNQKVLVDSIQNVSEFTDLVRYQHDIANNYELISKRVVSVNGKNIGKVINFIFDPDNFYVTKLNVKPGILKNLLVTNLLIDRASIVETQKNVILIKDNFAKVKKTASVALPQRS